MEEKTNNQMVFRRSLLLSVLLGAAYALAGNAFLYSAYFNSGIIKHSYVICIVMIVLFAVPVVWLFHNRSWYFPVFIFMFWVPFSVLFAFVLGKTLPLIEGDTGFSLLLAYFLILNVTVIVLGLALGMLINGCWALRNKFASK